MCGSRPGALARHVVLGMSSGRPRRTVEPERFNRRFVIRFRMAIEGHFIWFCVFRISTELRARARASW
jgi:hypothetical protein